MEVNWYLTSILIVFLGSASSAGGHDCDSDVSSFCREELANLKLFREQYQYASDNITLNEMCKLQLMVLDCVNSYAKTCLPEREQEVFKILMEGSDKFLDYFCFEDSKLQKGYLKHAACIRNVTSNLEDCTTEYKRSQKILEENWVDNPNTFKQRTCCLYFENISCSVNATSEMCGEEAAGLVRQLWILLGGTYLNKLCEPFTKYDYQSCSPVSKGSRTDVRFISVVFSILSSAISHYLR